VAGKLVARAVCRRRSARTGHRTATEHRGETAGLSARKRNTISVPIPGAPMSRCWCRSSSSLAWIRPILSLNLSVIAGIGAGANI